MEILVSAINLFYIKMNPLRSRALVLELVPLATLRAGVKTPAKIKANEART